jgi:hypothetical protein
VNSRQQKLAVALLGFDGKTGALRPILPHKILIEQHGDQRSHQDAPPDMGRPSPAATDVTRDIP